MKYLKLYENYFDNANKIENKIETLRDKLRNERNKKQEMKYLYLSEIVDVFNNLSEVKKEDTRRKNLKLNYKIKMVDGNIIEIIELIKFKDNDESSIRVDMSPYQGDSTNLYDMNLRVLSIILDALHYKYPEYFEGKGMGFFDLKTK